jgi:hypothetical protein
MKLIKVADLLANDRDWQGDALHITTISDLVGGTLVGTSRILMNDSGTVFGSDIQCIHGNRQGNPLQIIQAEKATNAKLQLLASRHSSNLLFRKTRRLKHKPRNATRTTGKPGYAREIHLKDYRLLNG